MTDFAHFPRLGENYPYGSVSAGREKWLFRVTFFLKVEPSCGKTVKDRHDFSIDPGQVGLGNPKNTLAWPWNFFWSPIQHP